MGKENRTDLQWLLDYSNSISAECGKTISDLLSVLDNNGIQYKPSYFLHTDNVPDKIYYMSSLSFDLAITLGDSSKMLIKLEMPEEALDQMEDIPGYGSVPSKAYEWLLKKYIPVFDDEEVETLYMLSQQSEENRIKGFQLRSKLIEDNKTLPESDLQGLRSELAFQSEFFCKPEAEREKYFDSHRQKLDFDAMSKEQRYDYLKAVDAILHPIIGNNGFPDWRDSGFIDRILKK